MRSPTRRNLDFSTIEALLGEASVVKVSNADELSGGGFAAVRRADGRQVVVKVG